MKVGYQPNMFGLLIMPLFLMLSSACGKTQTHSEQKIRLKKPGSGTSMEDLFKSKGPKAAAVSLELQDSDMKGGFLAGSIKISRATDESSITTYYVYFGLSDKTQLPNNNIPIAMLAKELPALTFEIPNPMPIPEGATHIWVLTGNEYAIMETGVSIPIIDKGVPENPAVSIGFKDTDLSGGKLAGTVMISKAIDELDVTQYALYWGSSELAKMSPTPITTLAKTGSNLSYAFPLDTVKPVSATHLLVYTRNKDGEMMTGVSEVILDLGVPVNAAISLAFTDTNLLGQKLSGEVMISKAINESDVTDYVLYWGSSATAKQSPTPIATIGKTGTNLTHTLLPGTGKPIAATHFLVFTKNADGEMMSGVSTAIVDKGVPANAAASVSFVDNDLDGGQISGPVTITKAINESDVNEYVLYFGSNATTKHSPTPIGTVAKTVPNLQIILAPNTPKPTSATHLLVFSKNNDGEMMSGVSTPIIDKGVPTSAAASVAFVDNDLDGGQISGPVMITKAISESDVTDYVLYFGSSATTKQSATSIGTVAKTGANLQINLAPNTPKPTSATHLLVFTRNASGEMLTGVSTPIVDKGVPTNAAASISFVDSDLDSGQISGPVTISKAVNESDITEYVLYFGSSANTKQSTTPIGTVGKTGLTLQISIFSNTFKPNSATHLLVFTRNLVGEMFTGVSTPLVDKGVPNFNAASVSFVDTDLDIGQISGAITITKAINESDITHYVVYFGSSANTKQSTTPIAILPKTGLNLQVNIDPNSPKPASATHILVFTRNADGERFSITNSPDINVSTPIVDKGQAPTATAGISCDSQPAFCTDAFGASEIGLLEFTCPLSNGILNKGALCKAAGKIQGCQQIVGGKILMTIWAYNNMGLDLVKNTCADLGAEGKLVSP